MCEVNKLQTNNMCAFHNDNMLVLNKDFSSFMLGKSLFSQLSQLYAIKIIADSVREDKHIHLASQLSRYTAY